MRIALHIFIWVTVFIVETLTYWKGQYWGIDNFTQAFCYNAIINVPKIIGVYVFIQLLLPRFLNERVHYALSAAATLLYLMIWLLMYRIILNYISWPIAFGVFPEFDPFNYSLSVFSFFKIITPLVLLLLVDFVLDRSKQKRRMEALEREKTKSELRFLKSQTNPHFLFNTLNNIFVLARRKSDLTAPMVSKLSKLLRFMLYETNQDYIPLSKEIEIIRSYIDLEKLRYDSRMDVELSQQIQDTHFSIPPFILLNFVENAFKHGASQQANEIAVTIKIHQTGDQLEFGCSNPYAENKTTEYNGLGLQNVKRRLQLCYPDNHILEIDRAKNRFVVNLKILRNGEN